MLAASDYYLHRKNSGFTILLSYNYQLLRFNFRVHMFEQGDSSNRPKRSYIFWQIFGEIWVYFCLNTGKCSFVEVSSLS